MTLYELLKIKGDSLDTSDVTYDTTVTCELIEAEDVLDNYDRFLSYMLNNVKVIDARNDICDWEGFVKEHKVALTHFAEDNWQNDVPRDEDDFTYNWINELHQYLAGNISEQQYGEFLDTLEKYLKEEEQYKEYRTYLNEKVKEYCNADGYITMYWDYSDEVPNEKIQEVINKILEGEEINLYDKIYEDMIDINMDYEYQLKDDFYRNIRDNAPNEFIKDLCEDMASLESDLLEFTEYKGIDYNIADLLKNTRVKVNIMFGTEVERDYDMSSIVSSYGNSWQTPFITWSMDKDNENDIEYYDNALSYLIHQQGHTSDEVFNCCFNNPKGFKETNDFVKSVVNEIANNANEMTELTALVELNGESIAEFCDMLAKGKNYLSFDKDVEIGLFNEWNGGGSLLEIALEKPFVVPIDIVRGVQIEGVKQHYSYSVDNVYGLIGSCWKDCLSYTNNAPDLVKEDYKQFIEKYTTVAEMLEKETEKDITDDE